MGSRTVLHDRPRPHASGPRPPRGEEDRPTGWWRRVAVALVLALVASSAPVLPGAAELPAGAVEVSLATQMVAARDAFGDATVSGEQVSFSEDGKSIGYAQAPEPGGVARMSGPPPEDWTFYWKGGFWVVDAGGRVADPEVRDLTSPGLISPHNYESQISGDGLTFVSTYRANAQYGLAPCGKDFDAPGDPGDPTAGAQYWNQQVLIWSRPTRTSEFNAPRLVTADPLRTTECTGEPVDGYNSEPMVGVGGDDASWSPSVSEDGELVAFGSEARTLGVATTDPDASGVFIRDMSGTGAPVEMVTPASIDGDVDEVQMNAEGDTIVFTSDATNLVTGLTVPSGGMHVYVAREDGGSWDIDLVTRNGDDDPATYDGDQAEAWGLTIDAAGDRVAFFIESEDIEDDLEVPPDAPPGWLPDPYLVVHNLTTATSRVVVQDTTELLGLDVGDDAGRPALSDDGERLTVHANRRLRIWGVDKVLSPADRRDALVEGRGYKYTGFPPDVDIASVDVDGDDGYLVAFGRVSTPQDEYVGVGGALYLVGGRGLGPDVARGWHGDPVDVALGAFRQDDIDLRAPTGSGPVDLLRTYSSFDSGGGIFGPGWTTPFDEQLDLTNVTVDGTVDLMTRTEGRVVFEPDGAGAWQAANGRRLRLLEPDGDDLWTVLAPDGTARRFDGRGWLMQVVTPGSPTVDIAWDDLTAVPTSAGSGDHEMTFTDDVAYDQWGSHAGSDGLVDKVQTSDGREVTYGYTSTWDGDIWLSEVSRPHAIGQPTGTYGARTYEATRGLITRITEQIDATRTRTIVENAYDGWGRVSHQVLESGDEVEYAYGRTPDPFGVLVDAPGFTTTTNTASGDRTVYEYNQLGELVGVTDATGASRTSSWASDRPEGGTSRSGVTTDQVYDDAGRLISVEETAGAATRTLEGFTYVVPDSSPAALTDDRVATHTDEAGVTTTYTYDGSARQPETMSVPCDPASTVTPCPPSGLATTTYAYHPGEPVRVASETDPDGVVTEYTYADDGSLETVTTHDGATPLVTTYDTIRPGDPDWTETNPAAVEVRTSETPGEAVTARVYDAEGRLIEERDPLYDGGVTHGPTTREYRFDGELASSTDPGGGVELHTLALPGDPGWAEAPEITEVRSSRSPDGVWTIEKLDRNGDVVVEQRGDPAVPAELATTTHVYGELGRLESTTDPMGVTTTYDYDAEGRVTEVIDEDDERTITAYDDFGRPTVVTDPLGKTTTTAYDADGRVASIEDREEADTLFAYDDAGRLHTTTDARTGVVERRYTLAGRLASETDATGRTTSYHYDTAGRQVEVELPSGATTTTAYDEDGRVATVTSPEGRVTSYTHDDLGRTLTIADPTKGTTTTTYTPTGEVSTVTDATGGVVTYVRSDGGRVETVTDPLTRVTSYGYDSRGNRVLQTDAKAGEREWHWNLADQLVEEVDPLDRSTTYTYDALGRLDVMTDGAGRTTDHGYDAAGQVTSLTYASGTPTTFGYDGEGRRTTMVDATGTTTWSYNATGQMTGANLPGSRDLAFAWDLAGRRTVIDYPDGARYRNVYDTDGRLEQVEFDNAGTWVDVAVNDYDDDGLLIEQDQGSGTGLREWTYDATTGRMTTYSDTRGAVTTTTSLTHDAAGRIASETTGGTSVVYDYDDAGQVVGLDRNVGNDTTVAYDELGRRTSLTSGASTTTYQWDAASQLTRRVVAGANHNYQYDASGRRTREAWNGGNRFIQFFWGARGNLTGQRYTEPGTVTDIARATRGDGSLATLTTTVNSVVTDTSSVVWDPTLPVPQPVWTGDPGGTNATRAVYGPDLIRVSCPTGTSCTGPVPHDVYGSALRTTATSAVVQDNGYTSWGDGGAIFTPNLNYGYRGELHSGDTIHLRARDYDPETGLFLSPDPLSGVDGTTTVANPYHYTDNDPINSVDPLGLRPCDDDIDCALGHMVSDPVPVDCRDLHVGPTVSAQVEPTYRTAAAAAAFDCEVRFFTGVGQLPRPGRSGSFPYDFHLGVLSYQGSGDASPPTTDWNVTSTYYGFSPNTTPYPVNNGRPVRLEAPNFSNRAAVLAGLSFLSLVTVTAVYHGEVQAAYQTWFSRESTVPNLPGSSISLNLGDFVEGRRAVFSEHRTAMARCREILLVSAAMVINYFHTYGWHSCV